MEVYIEYKGKEMWVDYIYERGDETISDNIIIEGSQDDFFEKLDLDEQEEILDLVWEIHKDNDEESKENWELSCLD